MTQLCTYLSSPRTRVEIIRSYVEGHYLVFFLSETEIRLQSEWFVWTMIWYPKTENGTVTGTCIANQIVQWHLTNSYLPQISVETVLGKFRGPGSRACSKTAPTWKIPSTFSKSSWFLAESRIRRNHHEAIQFSTKKVRRIPEMRGNNRHVVAPKKHVDPILYLSSHNIHRRPKESTKRKQPWNTLEPSFSHCFQWRLSP